MYNKLEHVSMNSTRHGSALLGNAVCVAEEEFTGGLGIEEVSWWQMEKSITQGRKYEIELCSG